MHVEDRQVVGGARKCWVEGSAGSKDQPVDPEVRAEEFPTLLALATLDSCQPAIAL